MNPTIKLETTIPPKDIYGISAALVPFQGLTFDEIREKIVEKKFGLRGKWYQITYGNTFASRLSNVQLKLFSSTGNIPNLEIQGTYSVPSSFSKDDITREMQISLLSEVIEIIFGEDILDQNR